MPTTPDSAPAELPVQPVHPRRDKGKLLQILGVGFGIAVAVGNSISAGIVRTPGDIAARLPNARDVFLAENSHFIPMEAPGVMVREIRAALDSMLDSHASR